MKLNNTIKTAAVSTALAGGLILSGAAIHKQKVREFRMSLLEQAEFTRDNPKYCQKTKDERCLNINEYFLLIDEYNKVKNKKAGKEVKSFEDKLNDKLIK